MAEEKLKKEHIEKISSHQEKILSLLREERNRAQQRFPLAYALLATFGLVCVFSGFYKFIEKIDLLSNNPSALVAIGLVILVMTGAAYKKLG